ncbi:hypothetical protein [Variovorax sp.]|nr:hypothetical protein [Variovorax sp.]HYP85654.1 hypothetical protein [Variovorax sp.]
MFKKILIANRGDLPRSGAAPKAKCMARAAGAGELTAETKHV